MKWFVIMIIHQKSLTIGVIADDNTVQVKISIHTDMDTKMRTDFSLKKIHMR